MCLDNNGGVRVQHTTALTWFPTITRETAHFGDCKAIDTHGRVFAAATSLGDGHVTVKMARWQESIVGTAPGQIPPAAAVEQAEFYSWRRDLFPCGYQRALAEHLESKRNTTP